MLKAPSVCPLFTRKVIMFPMYQREFSRFRPCAKGGRVATLLLLILSPCPTSSAVFGIRHAVSCATVAATFNKHVKEPFIPNMLAERCSKHSSERASLLLVQPYLQHFAAKWAGSVR
jgi:hypothetical protein